ncbi:MAG: transglutaminase-like domain-containing protein, partial [Planctomycetaceae bacterium]
MSGCYSARLSWLKSVCVAGLVMHVLVGLDDNNRLVAGQQTVAQGHAGTRTADTGTKTVPEEYRAAVEKQLAAAEENALQLRQAMKQVPPAQFDELCFLIANMPQRDLKSLTSDYLLTNIAYATRVRQSNSWCRELPQELFLEHVLPYVSANERRDDWRKDFFERFQPIVKDCQTATEAVGVLNVQAFKTLNVRYHATKRPKPDQSPYESIAAGYASCTGLSILLIDACRAVGIPARMVGTPLWTNKSGNHTWVEVWDGQWHFVGACEPGRLNKTWFLGRAQAADESQMMHRIYATRFRRSKTWFPLVWDRNIRYVAADDVTRFYTKRRQVTFENSGPPLRMTVRRDGRIVAAGTMDEVQSLLGDLSY